MKTNLRLTGLVAATHTPFNANGSLNSSAVELQAKHLSSQGISKVFVTGSTGESSSLKLEERKENIQAWAEAGKKYNLSVIAHVGGNATQDGVELSALAQDLGLAAVAALSPSYYKPATVQRLVDCCAEMAAACPELPFYYYDIPVLTNVRFSMLDFLKLAGAQIPNFAGIKFTNPDLSHYMETLNYENGKYDVPWGVDEWFLGALAMGAKGAVGSSFNFAPALYLNLMKAFAEGNMALAQDLQMKSIKMIMILAKRGYMGCAKQLMGMIGVPVGPARLPQGNPSADDIKAMEAELKAIGYFDWALA